MNKIYRILIVILIAFSACTDERDLSFLETVEAPSNVSLSYNVTQDNTGLVTLTPNGDSVTGFYIDLGDGTSEVVEVNVGENISHTYEEGTYNVKVTGFNFKGDETEVSQELVVSFKSPENLVTTISNNASVSKQVEVTAEADFAMMYEFHSGEEGVDQPVATANIGETITYQYANAGIYDIEIVVKGGAIETTSYTETFEVTAILQPIASAPTPPNRSNSDVISIYGDVYTNVEGTDTFPDWGQGGQGSSWSEFSLNGDAMLQYTNLSFQGIQFGSSQDVSTMEFIHLDVWTTDVAQLETSLINIPADNSGATEAPVTNDLTANEWTSIDIAISDYVDQGLTINEILQLKFVGIPWAEGTVFVDNIYFWKTPTEIPDVILGTWRLSSVAGALGVGPNVGDISWWNCDADCVVARACQYDDEYIFNADGTFQNVLQGETWIEPWQGGADTCGVPVAPHDGTAEATFSYDQIAGTLVLNGRGAYLGLPKAFNGGELESPDDTPNSVTYNATISDSGTQMSVYIETGSGVFWQYEFVKEVSESPLEGTWLLSSDPGSLGVGPTVGDISWWNCDADCVVARACQYDDQYVFNADGTFQNVLQGETWIEPWQGGADTCGTPVAPHDGSGSATYSYNEVSEILTLNGVGAYLGLPKANNTGELVSPADAPSSINYTATLSNNNTEMSVYIEAGSGVFWQYKFVKQ